MLIPFDQLFKKYNIKCTGILHCGASTGQEAKIYNGLKIPEVIWIEAIPEVFYELKKTLKNYPNQTAIRTCISNEDDKEVIFHVSNNEAQSSSFLELQHHSIIHPTVHYIADIPMITRRIDTLFKELNMPYKHLNFGNFDLQGAELLALKGLGEMIHQFDYFYLEVNKKETYKNCALVSEVDSYLGQFGFERIETSNWVADTWADSLYIKNSNFIIKNKQNEKSTSGLSSRSEQNPK